MRARCPEVGCSSLTRDVVPLTVPFLIATNPVNYGKPWRLVSISDCPDDDLIWRAGTADALCANILRTASRPSLPLSTSPGSRPRLSCCTFMNLFFGHLIGLHGLTYADLYLVRLSKFSWGHSFWEVNEALITRYLTCKSADDIRAMQDTIIGEMEAERDERRREKGQSSASVSHFQAI